jgi:hypothetical protein
MMLLAKMNPAHSPTARQPMVRQMWEGGPLRRWSQAKTPQTPMGHSTGFVGSYVCGQCLEPSEGVYRLREPQGWLCGACKRKLETAGSARR